MVREAQASVPGVFAFANQASLFGRNLGGGQTASTWGVGLTLRW